MLTRTVCRFPQPHQPSLAAGAPQFTDLLVSSGCYPIDPEARLDLGDRGTVLAQNDLPPSFRRVPFFLRPHSATLLVGTPSVLNKSLLIISGSRRNSRRRQFWGRGGLILILLTAHKLIGILISPDLTNSQWHDLFRNAHISLFKISPRFLQVLTRYSLRHLYP